MDTLLKDLKHSFRMFWQSRGFTAAAVAALALGIGANTAIFSVVNAVLLKPVPFPDPDRVMMLMNSTSQGTFPGASPTKFAHWREQSSVLQDVAAFRTGVINYSGGGFPEQFQSSQVSADYFRLFGAPVVLGRTFTAQEDLPGGEQVVVLSDGFWKRRFGGDAGIIGKTISLSGNPATVIGVIGPTFDMREFGPAPDLWVPFQLDPQTKDQGHYFQVAARLKPGVKLEQARARLKISGEEFRRKFPLTNADLSFSVDPIREAVVSNVRTSLLVLLGAVAFVLLIACANVANLLLARAVGRRREIAIRVAVGAGRGRIIRQLLTESVLLSLAGAVVGLAVGMAGIRALLSVNTANLPRVGKEGSLVGLDWRVLAFTVGIAVFTGVVFGLIPALQASRPDLSATLKESSGRSGTGLRQNKARTLLVIVEVALAVVLLVGSALLIRTSMALREVNPGFNTEHVLTMRMSLTGPRFEKSAGVDQLVREGLERLRGLPGVLGAAATCCVPLEGGYGLPFRIIGRPLDGNIPVHGGGQWLTISQEYFDVFRIPLIRGRAFNDRDVSNSEPAVIINQSMAQKFWPKEDPLGEKILIGGGTMRELEAERPRQIVGIVSDVRDSGLNRNPQPTMYIANAQVPDALNALNVRITPMAWVVRTRVEPYSLSSAIQEQLRQVSGLPVSDVRTMDEVVSRSISRQRFNMWLMTVFGVAALLLAAIGIYGLMAYSVTQRTQEIGIRLALGAESGVVRNMVVGQGMLLALIGVGVGIAAAFGLSRLIASLLYGVKASDPVVFVGVPLMLSAVALLAVWLPARRASRIDPIVALRYE
jgi:putative ABC transport system permease protein